MLLAAEPFPIEVDPARTALVVIDMQRDFLEPGGFGESLGNDVGLLRAAIVPCQRLLEAARARGHPGDPHARGPPPRSRRRAARQGRTAAIPCCGSAIRARWGAS